MFQIYGQMPAFVRGLLFFLVWLVVWLPVGVPLAIAQDWRPFHSTPPTQKLPLVLSLYALAPLVFWGLVQVEASTFAAYGLAVSSTAGRSLALGFGLAASSVGLVLGLAGALGWLVWQPQPWRTVALAAGPLLVVSLVVGLIEEAVFRGWLLTHWQGLGWIGAAVLSSLLFAALHLVWDGWAAWPQVPGLTLMGLVLVLARTWDGGQLALAWGLHAGWVWAIATLDTAQLFRYTDTAPAWGIGVGQQPLAGATGWLLLLGTGVLLLSTGTRF